MSTILKALRRLEEEKAAQAERPLREEVATAGPSTPDPHAPRSWIPVTAVALVAAFAGAAAWSFWPGSDARTEAVAEMAEVAKTTEAADVAAEAAAPARVARQPAPSRTERPPRPAPLVRNVPAPPPERADRTADAEDADAARADAFSSPVEVVRRPPVKPRVPIELSAAPETAAESVAPEPPTSGTAAAEPAPAIAAKPKPAPVVAKVEPTPRREPVVSKAEPAPRVAEEPAHVPDPAPVVETAKAPERSPEAPPAAEPGTETAARAAAPPEPAPASEAAPAELRVEKTLWHPQAGRRVAFVSVGDAKPVRIHEGDVVDRYVVSEIQPSGVVFLHDGKPIERKIGDD